MIIDAWRWVSIICQWDVSRVLAACASRCAFTRAKGCDRHADAPWHTATLRNAPLQRGASQLLGLQPVRFTSWWTREHPKSSSVKVPLLRVLQNPRVPIINLVSTSLTRPRYIGRIVIRSFVHYSFLARHFDAWNLKKKGKIKISLIVL